MCGIVGRFRLRGEGVDVGLVEAMAAQLDHRGPDARGAWADDRAGLGFRRLSFVDLVHGNQPLTDERGRIRVVCNGEIYNHRELRRELAASGHRFATGSDVEVIVHLYEELGPAMLERLRGQFALAVVDPDRRRLLLARDRFGVCPLFYAVVGDELVFGSELRALLVDRAVSRAVDVTALDQVLTFPGVLAPRTILRDVRSLPAGHLADVRDGRVAVSEYWHLDLPPAGERPPVSEDDAVDALGGALERAVRRRLDADVPIGYYVSGGVDSAVVARVADPHAAGHSFSVAFTDGQFDESRYQRQVVAGLGARWHTALVGPDTVTAQLRRAVRHAECPLKETYNVASLVLSGLARGAGVPGVLTGEGADELFAGYVGHRFDAVSPRRPPTADEAETREAMWGTADLFYEKDYAGHRAVRRRLYSDRLAASFPEIDCTTGPVVDPLALKGRHPLDQRCYLDFTLRLVDHLVSDHGDRMAMANSVEARYPFLDEDVVAVAAALPPELKLRGMTEKYVLRRLAARLGVPPAIVDREKFHFVAPGTPALVRSGSELVDHLLSPGTVARQGYFDPRAVQSLVDRCRQPGYELDLPYEDDLLAVVLTFGCLVEEMGLDCA